MGTGQWLVGPSCRSARRRRSAALPFNSAKADIKFRCYHRPDGLAGVFILCENNPHAFMKGTTLFYVGALLVAALLAIAVRGHRPSHTEPAAAAQPAQPVAANVPVFPPMPVPVQRVQNDVGSNAVVTPVAEVPTNHADDLRTRLEKRQALMSRLRDWAATDPEGALAWVQAMTPGDERDDALQAVCFGAARKDPAHALEMAQALQEPDAVIENLVQQWAGSDLPSALVWANNLPAGSQRDQLFQRAAFVLSQSDPVNAAGLILEQIPPGPVQDEAVMAVVHQWGNQNLVAAADWVKNFPDPLRERALQELEGIQQFREALSHP